MNAELLRVGDPPETNCGAGGRGQPRKQANSMEEITQDVAIQTKCNFSKLHMKRHTADADKCILCLWIKSGCDAWLFFLLKLTDGGGRSSVHLHLCYKCLIRSSWWYGFNNTFKWIHFHFDKDSTEHSKITKSDIVGIWLGWTWLLAWRRWIWNLMSRVQKQPFQWNEPKVKWTRQDKFPNMFDQ